jgi:3-hydroxy acid dehydrogenase / malonic semialdehyde reductase
MTESILVTGASSGIGLAVAETLIKSGYSVTGLCRRDLPESIRQHCDVLNIDLSDLKSVDRQLKEHLKTRHYDGLVHCAGIGRFGSVEQFSADQINQAIQINLTAPILLARRLIPLMRGRKKGRFVFMGSESALVAGKKGALYSAAKFGLRGFCQALRQDCAGDGIQVSLVNPGMVRSPFFDDQRFAPGADEKNAILPQQVADIVQQILQANDNFVFDEVNLSPQIKTLEFK